MYTEKPKTCRNLLIGAGLLFALCAAPALQAAPPGIQKGPQEEELSPAEDLMREHGVLSRVLLIYSEAVRRLEAGDILVTGHIADAAGVIRVFIEDYHEKLEEDHLFTRFRKAGKQTELVETLAAQHRAGRRLTDAILKQADAEALKTPAGRLALAGAAVAAGPRRSR